jgi:NAD(P)-dependent dehydrogenase (short-subunit alcohol dehydrogenase family)
MRVFVTGASGAIGSVVVPELIAAGHEVLGLARSEASAQIVTAAGATAVRGGLGDLEVLTAGAEQCDGVISLAFSNDFANLAAGIAEEGLALQALGAALIGTGKPLVIASGTPGAAGRPSTEEDPTSTQGPVGGRGRRYACLVPCTSAVWPMDSPECSLLQRSAPGCRATSATVANAGRPYIAATPPDCFGSPLSRRKPEPCSTPLPMRATAC